MRGLPPLTQRVLPHQRRDIDARPPPDSTTVRGERCSQGQGPAQDQKGAPALERTEETPAQRGERDRLRELGVEKTRTREHRASPSHLHRGRSFHELTPDPPKTQKRPFHDVLRIPRCHLSLPLVFFLPTENFQKPPKNAV